VQSLAPETAGLHFTVLHVIPELHHTSCASPLRLRPPARLAPGHARALHAAAVAGGNDNVQLWEISGFGHAESAIHDETLERIVTWVREQMTSMEG
jgi:hypothetical protein